MNYEEFFDNVDNAGFELIIIPKKRHKKSGISGTGMHDIHAYPSRAFRDPGISGSRHVDQGWVGGKMA